MNANSMVILERHAIDGDRWAHLFRIADGWLWSKNSHTTECAGPFASRTEALVSHAVWVMRCSRPIVIGETLTVEQPHGMLPGVHRGEVVSRVSGNVYDLAVFVPCRHRYERVAFCADQIVADGTKTTDLSVSACERYVTEALRAGIVP